MSKQPTNDVSTYITALQATYRPAATPQETTHWFTTDEVYNAIREIDPSADLSKEDIFKALTSAGFTFQSRPGSTGCEFRWMLTAR